MSIQKTMIELGKEIRRKRRAGDITQEWLASKVNCAQGTIQRIESGEENVSLFHVIAVCEELEIRSIKIVI